MVACTEIAIIGAGPYGLSLAAHLAGEGIGHRIFGAPMQTWLHHMPPGMLLKSDGKSSDLADPAGAFTLAAFCRERGLDYDRALRPVERETFIAYGLAFQQRCAPRVENKRVVRLDRMDGRFGLHFDDGDCLAADRVVIAVGVLPFRHVPAGFAHLPAALVSHSSDFGPLAPLAGRDVAILGAGSSALDLAALLHEQGARVAIVTRAPGVVFNGVPPARRDLLRRICVPDSKIGTGWLLRICDDTPQLVHALPEPLRRAVVRRTLGPSGGYFIRDRVVGNVAVQGGRRVVSAAESGGKVLLQTEDHDGNRATTESDHLILATGYRLDIARLGFLAPEITGTLATIQNTPVLSADFESSVSGLHFVGYASVPSFGPVMRFVAGTSHPARRLARHLARQPRRRFVAVHSRAVG